MNSNNLENEKLPVDSGEGMEETKQTLPVEEITSETKDESVEQATAAAEGTDTPTPSEVLTEENEIDYDLEVAEDEDEEGEDDIDENNVQDDDSVEVQTIEGIVESLRQLLESDNPQRKDVDEAKNQFYRSLRDETQQQKEAFIEGGGESIDFVAEESDFYVEGKELLQKIKEKRAAIFAEQEKEKEKNVARKLAIIERVKLLAETQSHEDFNKAYQEVRDLQQEWKDIKLVPQAKVNELWREFQRYVEKFYDLVRINNEFREYDFRKNLELKTVLCEAAERLDGETDVVSAFYQLQNLHQEWRDIGPVSRKDREEIWGRFKEASTVINRKYQAHFENLKGKEEENLEAKKALCEKLEAINYDELKSIRDWNRKVKYVLDIQKQWREIGYVPKKWNTKIYERYRAACDFFFRHRNDFYKSLHGEMEENLQKRMALIERAEALKDSTDWRNTTRELIEVQKQWKQIGIVPRKHVDSTWKRFIAACDYFFEQKKVHTDSRSETEAKNLEAKNALVEQINNLDTSLLVEEAIPQLRQLMDEWYAIGHVPYKVKDKAYKVFYDATEAQFDRLNVDKADRKLNNFKSNISDMVKGDNAKGQLLRERERLMRQYDRMKAELKTYENNIGFLSVSSKKGNTLIDSMNQKVKKIKGELDLIVKKISAIDKELE